VTGISEKKGEEIIKQYYGHPREWSVVVDSIMVRETTTVHDSLQPEKEK
jgi:hypothetical protein